MKLYWSLYFKIQLIILYQTDRIVIVMKSGDFYIYLSIYFNLKKNQFNINCLPKKFNLNKIVFLS